MPETTTSNPIRTPFGFDSTGAGVIEDIELSGKRAIVTGGSSGVGVETARALASAGAEVTLAVRDTVNTPLIAEMASESPKTHDSLVAAHPLGRIAEASEIADAIVWLCPERSSYVTGVALPVDRGYTAR